MKSLLCIIALSPLALIASRCVSISALVRIAVFAFLCFCGRLVYEAI